MGEVHLGWIRYLVEIVGRIIISMASIFTISNIPNIEKVSTFTPLIIGFTLLIWAVLPLYEILRKWYTGEIG